MSACFNSLLDQLASTSHHWKMPNFVRGLLQEVENIFASRLIDRNEHSCLKWVTLNIRQCKSMIFIHRRAILCLFKTNTLSLKQREVSELKSLLKCMRIFLGFYTLYI